MTTRRSRVLAVGGLAAALVTGCRSPKPTAVANAPAGAASATARPSVPLLPPPALRPAADARASLAFSVVVAPPTVIAGDLNALARKLGLDIALGDSFLDSFAGDSGFEKVAI